MTVSIGKRLVGGTLLGAALLVAGCVPSETVAPQVAAGETPVEPVGPGTEQADAITATKILQKVCVDTAPSFKKAPAVMAKMPFRQHPVTGTFYHQNLDLSIKLMSKRCSMVFTSKDDPIVLSIAISAAGGKQSSGSIDLDPSNGSSMTKTKTGLTIELDAMGRDNGRNWYRAVVLAP